MLEAKSLSFAYSRKGELVLDELSLTLNNGETGVILGPNGAGKSTLLKCLDGLLKPRGGHILLDGVDLSSLSRLERAKKIALVSQNPELGYLNVYDTVALGRLPYAYSKEAKDDEAETLSAIEMMGLTELMARNVNDLSGGERQKVAIARALAQKPSLLLFDEPTSSLDIKNQEMVASLISSLKSQQNLSILISMHDINLGLRLGERFFLFENGRIAYSGDSSVVNASSVSEVYEVRALERTLDGNKYIIIGEQHEKP